MLNKFRSQTIASIESVCILSLSLDITILLDSLTCISFFNSYDFRQLCIGQRKL